MKCTCSKLVYCEIHKDKPLIMPEVVKHHTFVIHIYRKSSVNKWFYTLTKDAVRLKISEDFETKEACIADIIKTEQATT